MSLGKYLFLYGILGENLESLDGFLYAFLVLGKLGGGLFILGELFLVVEYDLYEIFTRISSAAEAFAADIASVFSSSLALVS